MQVNGVERGVSPWALKAKEYKNQNGSIIVGDENYGEGSSREHAAMSPRYLGVKAVIARSFARIHETNLKKQGVLPLTFSNKADYDKIAKDNLVTITGLNNLKPGTPIEAKITGKDGSTETIELTHSLNNEQIRWFKAGSAMNAVNQPKASV
jgi:aconitate hydratase